MPKVLIVEDSRLFGELVKGRIEAALGFEALWVKSYAEALEALDSETEGFVAGLLDLNLPDAPMGEIVDLAVSRGVPAIIFSGAFSQAMRETVWSYRVVDYVVKENLHNIDYLVSLIRRLWLNRQIKVMVVDDSPTSRRHLADLLRVHRYQVLEAASGQEALELLDAHPEIRLVLTDYQMPDMDGFELTEKIRDRCDKEELAVIGISAGNDQLLSARYIKNGANDFIDKGFITEEFYCRITQNIEMLEAIQVIRESANKDFLTELFNRRYFFQIGRKLFASAQRGQLQMGVALLDLDHFKKVNDTFGHDAGDIVLRKFGELLKSRFRESDIVARFGGEEFCVLVPGMAPEKLFAIFDKLRKQVAKAEFKAGEKTIPVTVSIGLCQEIQGSLEEMIKAADEALYAAKREGRNRVAQAF